LRRTRRDGPPTPQLRAAKNHEIEAVGEELRGLFAWQDEEDDEEESAEVTA